MYCKRCFCAFEGERCPHCGEASRVRAVQPQDECFVLETPLLWGEVLCDLYRQSGMPYTLRRALGAGLATLVGPYQERYRFYVPYARLGEAQAIAGDLPADFISMRKEAEE